MFRCQAPANVSRIDAMLYQAPRPLAGTCVTRSVAFVRIWRSNRLPIWIRRAYSFAVSSSLRTSAAVSSAFR